MKAISILKLIGLRFINEDSAHVKWCEFLHPKLVAVDKEGLIHEKVASYIRREITRLQLVTECRRALERLELNCG